jgi:HlyD family secretion protein
MNAEKLDIGQIAGVRPKRTLRVRLAILAVVAAVAVGAYLFWRVQSNEGASAAYVTEPVGRGDITVLVTATGTVEPTTTVDISSELSGTITSVKVDYNDPVTKGQVLAKLDTTELEATVAHGRARVAAATARVAQEKTTLTETGQARDRAQALGGRGFTTQEAMQAATAAYDRAAAALEIAEADLAVARADLQVSEANLAKACICAPIDGIVLSRNVDAGQIIAASFEAPKLFTLAEDLRRMELLVDIDEADVGLVTVGDPATFNVEAWQDRTFPAEIAALRYAPQTIDGVVTYEAVLSIANDDLALRPGMTAVADITVEQVQNVLRIPNAALRFAPPVEAPQDDRGGSGLLGMLFRSTPSSAPSTTNIETRPGQREIWLLRDGKAAQAQIATGATDGLMTQVVGGDVKIGDLVITDIAETQ